MHLWENDRFRSTRSNWQILDFDATLIKNLGISDLITHNFKTQAEVRKPK